MRVSRHLVHEIPCFRFGMVKLQPSIVPRYDVRVLCFRFGMVKLQLAVEAVPAMDTRLFPLWHGKVATWQFSRIPNNSDVVSALAW